MSNVFDISILLNSFCNVITIMRSRDTSENYIYKIDEFNMNFINNENSNCYINDNVLIIDNPNLLNLNKDKLNFVNFKGEDILTQEQFSKIDGKNRLFWILDKKINNGKYCLESENGKIILKK